MGVHKNYQTGNYYIRIKYYGQEFEKVIGRDRRAAELALAEVKLDIKLSKLSGQGWEGFQKLRKAKRPKTFAELAKDYIEERANYKTSSLSSYKSILNHHLLPEFGRLPLKSITDSQLKKYQVRLSNEVSPSRVNTVMQLLRSVFDQAHRQGDLDRDPSKAVRRMQESKVAIQPLSEAELNLVLSNIEEHYRPLFLTLAYTGARPNELLALRWTDIDWKNKLISINKGRVRGREGLPKTKSGEREIPVSKPVESALNELRSRQLASINEYVFTNKKDNQLINTLIEFGHEH